MFIRDKALKNAVLRALADEEACRIFASTTLKPKSVIELTRECNIAHTSAYRLVNELKESGLLVVERTVLTDDGKKYAMYRSMFKRMEVEFDQGEVKVEADLNEAAASKAFRLFYSLPDDGEKERGHE